MSTDVFLLAKTGPLNTRAIPDGAPEGMNRTDVNDVMRETMAKLRVWVDDPEWLDIMRTSSGDTLTVTKSADFTLTIAAADVTSFFNAGRRIKVSGGGVVEGTVVSAAFPDPDTTVVVTLAGGVVIPAGTDKVELYFGKSLQEGAFGIGADLLVIDVFSH